MADTSQRIEATLTAARDDAEAVVATVKAAGGVAHVRLPVRARRVEWVARVIAEV